VAVAAVAIVAAPKTSSATARVARLESLVRCPSCDDLSVAQSNATTAVAVRREIASRVARGESDTQILTSIESTYGTSVLLSPPTTGLGALLWVVPVALVVAAALVALRLARRR
jgi:cytochrome c-type biogenesis protein CcmH